MNDLTSEQARSRLRTILLVFAMWDFVLAAIALAAPNGFESMMGLTPQVEPLFRRASGIYLATAGYFQLLGWRDPKKYVLGVQLAILFRLTGATLETIEAAFVLRPAAMVPHAFLLVFAAGDLVLAYLMARYLRVLGEPAHDFRPGT